MTSAGDNPKPSDWWHQTSEEVLTRVRSARETGLTDAEAAQRLGDEGRNELVRRERDSLWRLAWAQIREPMMLLLIVAAGVSIFIHEYTDAVAIFAIVLLSGALGFVQEYRAERAIAGLKRLTEPEVQVRRDTRIVLISGRDLVTGDIVLLEAGNRVAADCRVLESQRLQVQEAALTGESAAVEKSADVLPEKTPGLGDRRNMVYMGTEVAAGRAEAVVVETGMQTELGRIAELLQSVRPPRTPLQRRLARMSVWLSVVALGIVSIVFVTGLLRGQDLALMLMTAMSMAVAAVPEGLPAVATISMALGARRMLRRNALIRRLPAVETLGSVTVICADKTGTLTEGRMELSHLQVGEATLDLSDPVASEALRHHPPQLLALLAGALCNDVLLRPDPLPVPGSAAPRAIGDPTEAALAEALTRVGLQYTDATSALPRVAELPFDTERKRMTTVHAVAPHELEVNSVVNVALQSAREVPAGEHLALMKGAVESVLDVCVMVRARDGWVPLDGKRRRAIETAHEKLASDGKRVIGVAFRWINEVNGASPSSLERDFVFVGMAGITDPPRAEAAEAVRRCAAAGIRPIMITGDHPLTAQHIATQIGMPSSPIVVGTAVADLTGDDLDRMVSDTAIYARVEPEHKLRIVESLQRTGEIVAMTGDGVNDAPALKAADIGVAMGITGTDVSKDAADTVLLDDNFATIVGAVEEGRIIYDNIRKFLKYTMTSNAGEILVMLMAPLLGMPLPLVPLQILWINLVTDGLPGLALAVEPGERDVMQRPPRAPGEPVFDRAMITDIGWIGFTMGALSLGVGYGYWRGNPTPAYDPSWGTIVFTVLTLSQIGNALAMRSTRDSVFRTGFLSNGAMLASVALTFVLQMAVIYTPFLQRTFRTAALSLGELAMCIVLSTTVFWAVEAHKWFQRAQRTTRV